MKSTLVLVALATLVTAQLPPPAGPFTLGAFDPNALWGGTSINANGGSFWIGKDPSSRCPIVDGLDCSAYPGTETVLAGGNVTLSLNVAVPGGQQVYVGPDGALGYTPAHSTSKPTGSLSTGFLRYQSISEGAPVPMKFNDGIWAACVADATQPKVYKIYATAVGQGTDCTVFEMRTYGASGINAWQY